MKPGEVRWADLPPAQGREQAGKRPVIVLQDDDAVPGLPTVVACPLTSSLLADRFPATAVIVPDSANGLASRSVALVFQVRALDRRRLHEAVGHVSANDLETIRARLSELQGVTELPLRDEQTF